MPSASASAFAARLAVGDLHPLVLLVTLRGERAIGMRGRALAQNLRDRTLVVRLALDES